MLKTWTKVVDSCSNQLLLRVDSKLLETKPFQLIINKDHSGLMSLAGVKNQELRGNNQKLSLDSRRDSRFSILARTENQVSTYFWMVLYHVTIFLNSSQITSNQVTINVINVGG